VLQTQGAYNQGWGSIIFTCMYYIQHVYIQVHILYRYHISSMRNYQETNSKQYIDIDMLLTKQYYIKIIIVFWKQVSGFISILI